jgi:hypothetical protein
MNPEVFPLDSIGLGVDVISNDVNPVPPLEGWGQGNEQLGIEV